MAARPNYTTPSEHLRADHTLCVLLEARAVGDGRHLSPPESQMRGVGATARKILFLPAFFVSGNLPTSMIAELDETSNSGSDLTHADRTLVRTAGEICPLCTASRKHIGTFKPQTATRFPVILRLTILPRHILILRQTMLRSNSRRPHSPCVLLDEICSRCTTSCIRRADHTLPSRRLVYSWATPTPSLLDDLTL